MIIVYGQQDYQTARVCRCGSNILSPYWDAEKRKRVLFKCRKCGANRRTFGEVKPYG